jgi:hypothetical protein
MIKHCVTMPQKHMSIIYQHLILNTLLKCCKSIDKWRGQVCDVNNLS